jgi:signal recognition particle subunit SRP19
MRVRGKLLLWPVYFDSNFSRRFGRRVPRSLALRGVRAEELFEAALQLGLNPDLQIGSAYSRRPYLRSGSVLVDKINSKTSIVRSLANKVHELRRLK